MIRNRAQLAEKVRRMIGDGTTRAYSTNSTSSLVDGGNIIPADVLNFPDGSSKFFSDAAYGRFISDAYVSIARGLNFCDYAHETTTVNGTSSYTTDTLQLIYHVDFNDFPLVPINAAMLNRMDEKWKTRFGQPRYWLMGYTIPFGKPLGVTNAAPGDANREYQTIRLYPTPNATGDDLRIIGLSKPEALISDIDCPAMPAWLMDVVVYEAAARILESHGPVQNFALSAAYRQMRDFYLDLGLQAKQNRAWGKISIRGEAPRTPYTLFRQTHIPFTGLAPGDAE